MNIQFRRLFHAWTLVGLLLGVFVVDAEAQTRSQQARRRAERQRATQAARRAPVRAVMNKRIEALEWDEQPLESIMDWLRSQGTVNVVVVWRALEAVGIDSDTPVSLRFRDVTVRQVLTEALEQISDGAELRFRASGSTIKISTRDDLNRKLYTRVYDVSDLIFQIPDFKGPRVDIAGGNGGGGGGGGGGGLGGGGGGFGGGGGGGLGGGGGGFGGGGGGFGGGGGGFGGGGGGFGGGGGGGNVFEGGDEEDTEDEESVEERMDRIVELIRATIEPDTWIENGGRSSVTAWNRSIVIRAPIEVHEWVGGPFHLPE